MRPLPDAARAYAAGWALSGARLGERFDAGILAAASGDDHLAEVTLKLGALTGTWAQVYDRQDALYDREARKLTRIWRKLTAEAGAGTAGGIAVARMVAAFRRRALMTGDGPAPAADHESPDGRAERRRELRAIALAAAAAMLAGLPGADLYPEFLAAISAALAAGAGEGFAAALALAASDAGHAGFDWDAAQEAGQQEPDQGEQMLISQALIAAMASGVAAVLVAGAVAGVTAAAMAKAVKAALHEAANLAVTLTHAIGSAISSAWLAVYDRARAPRILWVTAGDDRVCPVCDGYEADNPYTPETFPPMPAHFKCRCAPHAEGANVIDLDTYARFLTDRRAA
jgi:hypothetical protein